MEIDPLRPLNNMLWGYIQDEQHRLTVVRRAYEYDHHYGMTLYGKAVPKLHAADSRSKFLEAFHHLLYLCTDFFESDDDTTVIPDGFPLLNALKEVHLLLAEGVHNQFGDLPRTARLEMLIQQWLLGGRNCATSSEPADGSLQRVLDGPSRYDEEAARLDGSTVTHFHDLAVFGEQLLLSIRYGDWSDDHQPGVRKELGALLALGNPGLHPCLPGRNGC